MRNIKQATTALLLGLAATGPAPASAEKVAAAADKSVSENQEYARLRTQLTSGVESAVFEALRTVVAKKEPAFTALIAELLNQGGTPKVLVAALESAGKLRESSLSPSAAPYLRHRDGEVRKAAARALARTGGPGAVSALRLGLRSPDAFVRGTAASGLGSLDAKEALDDLYTALQHNVAEAAASIGQLCDPEQCDRLLERVGKIAFDVITSGLDQLLFRPSGQMPDEYKLKVVARLRELGTREAGAYLADVRSRWPAEGSATVRQALDSAVKANRGRSE